MNLMNYFIFLYIEIKISPARVTPPPKNIFKVIISAKIKYAKIVAIIGSPSGNAATIVGDTYLTE